MSTLMKMTDCCQHLLPVAKVFLSTQTPALAPFTASASWRLIDTNVPTPRVHAPRAVSPRSGVAAPSASANLSLHITRRKGDVLLFVCRRHFPSCAIRARFPCTKVMVMEPNAAQGIDLGEANQVALRHVHQGV